MNEQEKFPERGTGDTGLTSRISESDRDRVIRILTESYSRNLLNLEEFENRVSLAETASSRDALETLVRGFPEVSERQEPYARRVPALREAPETFTGIMSSRRLRGDWLRSAKNRVLGVMSSQEFDFRETEIPSTGVELQVTAVMADIRIIVPPGVDVILDVLPIMADVKEDRALRAARFPKGTPFVRVTGTAVMADIKVKCRT